jgi:hypothetical protein
LRYSGWTWFTSIPAESDIDRDDVLHSLVGSDALLAAISA